MLICASFDVVESQANAVPIVLQMFLASLLLVWGDFVRRAVLIIVVFWGSWLLCAPEASALEKRLIAVIMSNAQSRYQDIHAVFVDKMQPFIGTDCRIYVQTPNADIMSLRNSVRKAVALGADLIVTYGSAATLAAEAETPPMPTVFADVYDPVGLGLVSATRQTGRNMTGVRGDAPVQALFKYFIETNDAKSLAVFFDTDSQEATLQKNTMTSYGPKRGVLVSLLPAVDKNKLATFLRTIPGGVDGLFLANSEHGEPQLKATIEIANALQVPVITQRTGAAEAGAFMVLESRAEEQGEKVAEIVKAVLGGTKVREIPMDKPHQVDFVVNLKVAKSYNIKVPFQTLSVASRVIR